MDNRQKCKVESSKCKMTGLQLYCPFWTLHFEFCAVIAYPMFTQVVKKFVDVEIILLAEISQSSGSLGV
jgi:hypothetical protein